MNLLKRNQMKKILAVFFLLIYGLIILLATVDLEPYLAPDQFDISEEVYLPPVSKTDEPPIKAATTKQTETHSSMISEKEQTFFQPVNDKLGDLFEKLIPAAPVDKSTTGPGQTTSLFPRIKVDEAAVAVEQGQTPSAPIELEVTILPVGEYPFSILLETFLEQETAQQAVLFYQQRDISAHWVKVNLGEKGIRYRLFTGAFSTESEAQQYLKENQLFNKLIKPTVYSARVGVYQDKAQLASDYLKTRKTGIIPYILGTPKGLYHLYVGAFYTYIGSTAQCRDLTDAGLSCEPVKRSTIPPQ